MDFSEGFRRTDFRSLKDFGSLARGNFLEKLHASARNTVANDFYHVYNRGHNRDPIFFEDENYRFFLRRLREYVTPQHALVIGYVLMPNHFHLLVQARTDHLSRAMQLFGISYTKAINRRFQHAGSVFQGAFRAKAVDRDEYLLHLSRYIHLNPVRAGLVKEPEEWSYSSYPEYLGFRVGSLPHPEIILNQFLTNSRSEAALSEARGRYRAFVQEFLEHDREKIAHLLFSD